MTDQQLLLPLSGMAERHPGLSSGTAQSFYEAARVCLNRHHESPTGFSIENNDDAAKLVLAQWKAPDAKCQAAHANETDATSWGAYCCALACTELIRGLVAISRAENGTGADYYLGKGQQVAEDLEVSLRLEVSGIDDGTPQQIRTRLLQKVLQAKHGASNLPALAAVVGFKATKIALTDVS